MLFLKFSHLFGLFSIFLELAFRELLFLLPKTSIIASAAVTLPVFEFPIAISLVLVLFKANLVTCIGPVSVDIQSMSEGLLSNLKRLSK